MSSVKTHGEFRLSLPEVAEAICDSLIGRGKLAPTKRKRLANISFERKEEGGPVVAVLTVHDANLKVLKKDE